MPTYIKYFLIAMLSFLCGAFACWTIRTQVVIGHLYNQGYTTVKSEDLAECERCCRSLKHYFFPNKYEEAK